MIRASPIAVESFSDRLAIAVVSAVRSSVGGTSIATVPLNDTRPTSMSSATWAMKSVAACWAAANRVGGTSSAAIEFDTSNSTTMRPSLSVRSSVVVIGRAIATTPAASPAAAARR